MAHDYRTVESVASIKILQGSPIVLESLILGPPGVYPSRSQVYA